MSPPDFSLLWGAALTRSGVHSCDSMWRINSGAAAWRNWQRQWTPAPRPFNSSRMASRSPPALTSAKVRPWHTYLWFNSVIYWQCRLVWIQRKHLLRRATDDHLWPPALSVRTQRVFLCHNCNSRCNSIASDRSALPPRSSATQLLCFWQCDGCNRVRLDRTSLKWSVGSLTSVSYL